MILYEDKLKPMNGYREGKQDAIDKETLSKALAYKQNFLKKFIAIYPQIIDKRLGDGLYYVTRKYDGEFATIIYDKGTIVTVNRSGRIRTGLPCLEEAAALLEKAGVKEAIIPAEIYVDDSDKHTRTHDLLHALSKKGDVSVLRLAAFDILELNGEPYKPENYVQTHELLEQWFGKGKTVKAVEMEIADTSSQVKDIYRKWVDEGTAEGLVVRSEFPFVFKIKPRHYIDAVVIGFTEGTGDQKGQIRTFLVAMMPDKNHYQVVGNVGGGMKDETKSKLLGYFNERIVRSDYIDTDSNYVAFRMVRPDTVMEFNVRDVIYETANGPVTNTLLTFDGDSYGVGNTVTGISFVAPVFERIREDKIAEYSDVRLSQIEDFASFEPEEIVEKPQDKMAQSDMILRDIYTKKLGEKFMVQKYLIWKTRKEKSGNYPAYVLHYTNYSSNRKDPLQRELRISDSEEQIDALYKKMLEENIKKGWEKYIPEEKQNSVKKGSAKKGK